MINILDILGIVVFLLLFIVVLKRYWFYSLYSFIRFLLFSALSLGTGFFLSSLNPFNFFLSKLQIALLITGILFTILWKFLSFKKIFFWLDTHLFKIDRFVYFHKLNKFINIPPSLVASSFFTFFLFTLVMSIAPFNTVIGNQVDGSRIFKPLSFKIYFSPSKLGDLNPFEGTVFDIPNPLSPSGRGILDTIRRPYVIETATKINGERAKAGLPPIEEVPIEYPSEQTPSSPSTPIPSGGSTTPTQPRQSPIVIKIPSLPSSQPTPTTTPIPQSVPTPTPRPSTGNPSSQPTAPTATPIPTATPTPTPTPPPAPRDTRSIEQRIFELTNEKRAENGVRALAWSEEIAVVARAHSKDMVDRNYFSHNSPEGVTPFQRLSIGGISYSTAGENIATAGSAELIMNAWMNSPGHRANILNASFGKIGIGVVENARYGLMATQNFTN